MTLLITPQEIKSALPIKNVDEEYVIPAIRLAQDKKIQLILGTNLYEKLQQFVESGSVPEPYATLHNLVKDVLLWQSMGELTYTVTWKVRNAGVVQSYGEHIYTSTFGDADQIQNNYFTNANFYENKLQRYLDENRDKFPELEPRNHSDYEPRETFQTTLYLL